MWRPDAGMFDSPKGAVTFTLESPHAYASAENRFFTRTLTMLIDYALSELLYFAELGAYRVTCESVYRGIILSVVGPRHKLLTVAEAFARAVLAEALAGPVVGSETKYRDCADKVLRATQSLKVSAAYQQASDV